jgi:hypothetical protein
MWVSERRKEKERETRGRGKLERGREKEAEADQMWSTIAYQLYCVENYLIGLQLDFGKLLLLEQSCSLGHFVSRKILILAMGISRL